MSGQETIYNVLISTYIEPELVERIRQVNPPRLNVIYEPAMLGQPRYAADHTNLPQRTPDQEARWRQWLAEADILFDFDPTHRADLSEAAPKLRWVQSTSAGIGQFVKRSRYAERMPQAVFTTASGVHARPLAEFCMMAMLVFNKGLLRMFHDQAQHKWERYAGTDLDGRTLGIIGVGKIGCEVTRLANAFGMHVLGINAGATSACLDRLYCPEELHKMLPHCEYLVVAAPHTPQTERMIGAAEFALLPAGAMFINIGRGQIVDEPALIAALRSGHLGGAALDVVEVEPLPADSPLWDMPNVLISTHSASTSDRENSRITDLFCENLRRFLADEPLLNVLDPERMY